MKKITKPLSVMAWVMFASMTIFAFSAQAQCPPSTIPFGSAAAPTVADDSVAATTCAFAGEYSTFTGLDAGEIYRAIVTTTTGSGTPYLTLYQPGDTIPVGFAFTSRAFTGVSGDIQVHVTQSDTLGNFCLTESACHTVLMECISCDTPILGCTNPLATNFDSTANTDDGSCIFATPANDSCANAIQIACGGTATGTTLGATIDANAPFCGTSLNTAAGVWYFFAAAADELVTVSLCGSNYDTKLGVYNGTNCDSLACVGGNDDDFTACGGLQSQVTFTSTTGQVYPILVTGFSTATGNYNLSVTCEAIIAGCTDPDALNYDSTANVDDGSCIFPPPPTNDSCTGAIAIAVGSGGNCPTVSALTTFATPSDLSSTSCDFGTNNVDLWYTFVAGNSAYEIDVTLGTAGLVEGAVYADSCGGTEIECFFNADGGVINGLTIGNTYYLQLWTDDFNVGSFDFCLRDLVAGCTDPNALNFDSLAVIDDGSCIYPGCASNEAQIQIEVTIGSFAEEQHWTFEDALGNVIASAACGQYAGAAFGAVFTTVICVDTCEDYVFNAFDDWGDGWNGGSFSITNLDDSCLLASGSPNNFTVGDGTALCDTSDLEQSASVNTCNIVGCTNPIATNYNPCATIDDGSCQILGCTDPNALNFDSTATVDDGSCQYAVPANDTCGGAIQVFCGDTVSGTTQGASVDTTLGTCGTILTTAPGVWYGFIGTGDGVVARTCGSAYDTKLGVFEGSCSALVCIDGNDDACGLQSEVQFVTTLGTIYYIYVSGFGTASGSFDLTIECLISGCTDPQALNFDSNAVIDDGSCVYAPCASNEIQYTITVTPSSFPEEIHWTLVCDSTGDTIASAACGSYGPATVTVVCLDTNQTYTFNAYDDWGDGWNGGTYEIVETSSGSVVASGSPNNGVSGDATADCAASQLEESITITPGEIAGCTDPQAVNFNPAATVDDGSCVFLPANDLCANAAQVQCGSVVMGSTVAATNTGAPGSCVTSASTAGGVWYFYVGTGDIVTASLCGSNYDTKIFVYEAPNNGCDSLVCVTGNDDFCGLQSQVVFNSNPGTLYIIYVAGFGAGTGNYTLALTCVAPPCAAPTNLADNNTTTKSTTLTWDPVVGAVGYQLTGSRVGFPPIAPITLGPVTQFNVNNLLPSVCYYWQVRAVCSVDGSNVSAYSAIDTFCMLDPCPVPAPLFETNLTQTSVTLNWAVVAGAQGYQIYGKAAASSNIVVLNINNGAQSSFQVNNLPCGTTFQWAVRASCPVSGFSNFTPISTFSTLACPASGAKTSTDNPWGDLAETAIGVQMFPNPTTDVVNFKFTETSSDDVSIELMDMNGRTISMTNSSIAEGNVVSVDVASFANGVYQVVITNGENVIVERLMIAR